MRKTHEVTGHGMLCGQRVTPMRILDGIADDGGGIAVIHGSDEKRMALDSVPRRAMLVGATGIGMLCLTGYASYVATLMSKVALSRAIGMVVSPVLALMAGGIAALQGMALDNEESVRDTLVTGGSHIVHIKASASEATEPNARPTVHVTITHAIIGKGTATRDLGGVTLSNAERYELTLPQDGTVDPDEVEVTNESYIGSGRAHVPDVFEVPLSETLDGWVKEDGWIWAKPFASADAGNEGGDVGSPDSVASDEETGSAASER